MRSRQVLFARAVLPALVVVAITCTAKAETLEDTLSSVYRTNPTILAARAEVRRSAELASRARSGWMPLISMKGEYVYNTEQLSNRDWRYDLESKDWLIGLEMNQTIYSGNRVRESVNVAEKEMEIARVQLNKIEQQTLQKSVSAYMDIVKEELIYDYIMNEVSYFEDFLAKLKRGNEGISLSKTSIEQITAEVESLRANCVAQHAKLLDKRWAFEELVGDKPILNGGPFKYNILEKVYRNKLNNICLTSTDINDRPRSLFRIPAGELPLPRSVEEAIDIALQNNPELKESRIRLEQSTHAVNASYAELMPRLDLSASAATSGQVHGPELYRGRDQAELTLRMEVPLFQRGSEWASIRSGKEKRNQLRLQMVAVERQIRRAAAGAWFQLRAAEAERKLNRSRLSAQSKSLGALIQGFHGNDSDGKVFDLIFQRRDLLFTQIALATSDRDYIVFKYELLKVMGKFTPEAIGLSLSGEAP